MSENQVVYFGDIEKGCDFCGEPILNAKYFYDARTKQGSWGLLCPQCFVEIGVGLGTGKGQEYYSETQIKVRG